MNQNLENDQQLTVAKNGYTLAGHTADYTTKLRHADWTGDSWNEKLDWLFFANCSQAGALTSISDEQVEKWDCMPSKMFPSDHMAQGYTLKIM